MRLTVQSVVSSMPTSAAVSSSSASPGRGRADREAIGQVIVWRGGQRSFFVYGFAKSGQADLTPKELEVYQRIAGLLLGYDDDAIKGAMAANELVELTCDD